MASLNLGWWYGVVGWKDKEGNIRRLKEMIELYPGQKTRLIEQTKQGLVLLKMCEHNLQSQLDEVENAAD